IWPTPYSMTASLYLSGGGASRLELPIVPAESSGRPPFPAIEPPPPLEGISSTGDIWPPKEWTVTRDLMTGTTRVAWSGEDAGHYPWGNTKDYDTSTDPVRDDDPAVGSVHADASTTVMLPSRTLLWSVVLDL